MNCRDILDRYQRYGWTVATGEWGHIQNAMREELRDALRVGDEKALQRLLEHMLSSDLATGLVSVPTDEGLVGLVITWRLALWAKLTGEHDMTRLNAPVTGSPIVMNVGHSGGNAMVTLDSPRFDHYAKRILGLMSEGTVMEIGPGYGGTALQLLRRTRNVQVLLVDIPETLYLAGWYLSEQDYDVAWWDDDPYADVVLIPAHELESADPRPDMVFSSHTLSGLPPAEIARYLAWMSNAGVKYFYHDDATFKVEGIWFTDTFDETLAHDIKPTPNYELTLQEQTPWTAPGDRFSEFFYVRRN